MRKKRHLLSGSGARVVVLFALLFSLAGCESRADRYRELRVDEFVNCRNAQRYSRMVDSLKALGARGGTSQPLDQRLDEAQSYLNHADSACVEARLALSKVTR